MAGIPLLQAPEIDTKAIGELVWQSMPPQFIDNFAFLFNIAKAVGVLFIIYVVFLILKSVIQTRQALKIK